MSNDFKEVFYRRTYKYALDVLRLLKTVRNDSAVQVINNQLVRSATSVAANLVEARGASSRRDYVNFYSYALKSANESAFWLTLLRDYLGMQGAEIERLIDETIQISKILGASILTMKGKRSL